MQHSPLSESSAQAHDHMDWQARVRPGSAAPPHTRARPWPRSRARPSSTSLAPTLGWCARAGRGPGVRRGGGRQHPSSWMAADQRTTTPARRRTTGSLTAAGRGAMCPSQVGSPRGRERAGRPWPRAPPACRPACLLPTGFSTTPALPCSSPVSPPPAGADLRAALDALLAGQPMPQGRPSIGWWAPPHTGCCTCQGRGALALHPGEASRLGRTARLLQPGPCPDPCAPAPPAHAPPPATSSGTRAGSRTGSRRSRSRSDPGAWQATLRHSPEAAKGHVASASAAGALCLARCAGRLLRRRRPGGRVTTLIGTRVSMQPGLRLVPRCCSIGLVRGGAPAAAAARGPRRRLGHCVGSRVARPIARPDRAPVLRPGQWRCSNNKPDTRRTLNTPA